MSGLRYDETCFDCDGWNLSLRSVEIKNGVQWFAVVCKDCGAEWTDFDDEIELSED